MLLLFPQLKVGRVYDVCQLNETIVTLSPVISLRNSLQNYNDLFLQDTQIMPSQYRLYILMLSEYDASSFNNQIKFSSSEHN